MLVLLGALAIRMVGTYFAVSCGNLNTKEKIFMAFAWMPKATVQAALGPVFLDNAIKYGKVNSNKKKPTRPANKKVRSDFYDHEKFLHIPMCLIYLNR